MVPFNLLFSPVPLFFGEGGNEMGCDMPQRLKLIT